MAVTCDPDHKFELAIQLGELKVAYQLAVEAEVNYFVKAKATYFVELEAMYDVKSEVNYDLKAVISYHI